MVWISVHETVMGAKLRRLAKALGCSQNEALGILVRLWLWGMHNANEAGETDASKEDVADVLNVGLSKLLEPERVIEELIEVGYLDKVEPIRLHDWAIWQKWWYKREHELAKNREYVRRFREKQKETEAPPKKNRNEYPKEFEEFWKEYPRKIGKADAYKCYKDRISDGWTPDELIESAKNYCAYVRKTNTEQTFIKHPKTFLSASTPFSDYLSKQESQPQIVETNENDPFSDWR